MAALWEFLASIGLQLIAKWISYQNIEDDNVKKFYAFVEAIGARNQVAARLHLSYKDQLMKLGITHSDT